ncbi:MAG: GT4 family glycosyltransferase PelF [Ruthenibacterium sp.]
MRICMILEGCYPYVTGGVSSWMHQYILAMPQHEFVLWVVGAHVADRGKFKYTLPENVVEVREVFLDDALQLRITNQKNLPMTPFQLEQVKALIACENPDWDALFEHYHGGGAQLVNFLMSRDFLAILETLCRKDYPYVPFTEMFHMLRSMLLPMLYLMQQPVPEADVYHAACTGYGGLLAALAAWCTHRPMIITEHGIYSREREEELIRAKWVLPTFKPYWTRFFYMLSTLSYQKATCVSCLFEVARNIQISLHCPAAKTHVIANGVHYERFCDIPPKKPDGWIDFGAVIRIAPIKDIKTMLHAFSELKQHVPNVRLHILGAVDDEEYAEECHALVRQLQLPDVIFTGMVNVISYFEKLDFTLLSSISEGQPLSVLESLAAGRPCVTTDVGCCRALLEGNDDDAFGSAGYCVPPMHKQAFAHAMEQMCNLTPAARQAMQNAGRQRVARFYRHADMIQNYLKLYEEAQTLWQASDLN